ncbi:hypothetical protein GCM10010954_26150 [Halobacillus andaensis]|uniref:Uncharacterized protein n=1 Tax=Halobacillus andaensis TaxID=1176239 RepID=A0A917B5V7_HALAA|nr:hypothetical protein [Halobacillus andaensis]MBP2005800.1 uncharacterized membrane protein YdcZ (DUF606 family) [Halobacillus andaensis]GGF25960.1 hypothetical protein GCM10010954_26150 [Halobacillus andaensis]
MGNKICWIVILLTLAINVMLLQWTINAYLGHEFERVFLYSLLACGSASVTLITVLIWRKKEYQ